MDNIQPIMVIAVVLIIIAMSGRCSADCTAGTNGCQDTGTFRATDGFTDHNYPYYTYFHTFSTFYCPANSNDCAQRCSTATAATGATYTNSGGNTRYDGANGAYTTYDQGGAITYTNAGGFNTGTGTSNYTDCFSCCTACCPAPAD